MGGKEGIMLSGGQGEDTISSQHEEVKIHNLLGGEGEDTISSQHEEVKIH